MRPVAAAAAARNCASSPASPVPSKASWPRPRQQIRQGGQHQIQAFWWASRLMMQNNGPATAVIQAAGASAARPCWCALSCQPGVAIARRNMRVLGGVPGHLVDAVQDPGELPGAMVQQAVEAHAELGSLDLARVGRAHGRDVIGEMQAGLQEADLAVVLDALDAESLRRQTQLAQQPGREIALEGDVVDRLHGRRTLSAGERQIGRGEASMPVVGMNHVGTPIEGSRPRPTRRSSQPKAAKRRAVVAPVPAVRPEIGTGRPGRRGAAHRSLKDRHARRGTAGDEPRRPAEKNRRWKPPVPPTRVLRERRDRQEGEP